MYPGILIAIFQILSESNRFHADTVTNNYYNYSTVGQKIEKSPGKKLVKSNISKKIRELAFLVVLNFFPLQKLIFGDF